MKGTFGLLAIDPLIDGYPKAGIIAKSNDKYES